MKKVDRWKKTKAKAVPQLFHSKLLKLSFLPQNSTFTFSLRARTNYLLDLSPGIWPNNQSHLKIVNKKIKVTIRIILIKHYGKVFLYSKAILMGLSEEAAV